MQLELGEVEPLSVAAYIEQVGAEAAKPTVKQHFKLAFGDWRAVSK